MTTVDKLAIQGIRSYGPDDRDKQTIEFGCPLTLILGKNGSGKTTIIECLRMSTSGALPPNASSGQSFVHDPRASNRTKTSSLIRMMFTRLNGEQVTVKQTFELANKSEHKQQFRKVSCEIGIKSAKGEVDSKRKCADDSIVPMMMGVTKALLQHVIFCHQEESNWILGDSRSIKEKFDAIFSSTKYAKALESIRKTQQETKTELKEMQERVSKLRVIRDHARQRRDELQSYQQKSEESRKQIAVHQERCDSAEARLNEVNLSIEKLRDLQARLETLETCRAEAEQDVQLEFEEDVETLEELMKDLKGKDQRCQKSLENLEKEEEDLLNKAKACKESISQLNRERDNVKRDQQILESKKDDRLKYCTEIAEEYGLSQDKIAEVGNNLESPFYLKFGKSIEEQHAQSQKELEKHNSILLECHEKISQIEYKAKETSKRQNERRDQIKAAEIELTVLRRNQSEKDFKKFQQELDEIKKQGGQERYTTRIDEFRREKESIKRKKEDVEEELKKRSSERDEYLSWKRKQQDYDSHLAKANEVLTEHLEKFNEILKFRPDLESLQSGNELLEASKASKQNLGKIKDELLQCDRSLESADVELAKINSMIVELTKGCRNRMEQFQGEAISGGASKEVIEGSAVDEHLKQLLMGLNEDKENFNQQSVANRSLKTLVETFEKFASEHRKCPICAKQVESDKQLEKIRSKCASLQADITPEVLKTLERNVQGIERKIQALSTAIQLRQELKDLEAQLAEKSREKEHILATKAEFVNAQVSWKERQQEAAEYDEKVNHLSLIVDEMDLKTLAKAKSELSSSKFSDDVKESCENRSYENLLNSRKELEDECLELESKIEALYKQRDSSKVKEETLQKEISSFNEIQLRISKLEKQVVDTEKELRNAEREMESDEKLLVKKEEEKSSLNDKIAKLQQSNDTVVGCLYPPYSQ
eukprot:489746-Hanusia_phi.AAC.8